MRASDSNTEFYQWAVIAREMALRVHQGQVDKAGRPYVEHLERVARAVEDDWLAVTLAWLHDLGEDHPEYWGEIEATFPTAVVWRLRLLDRTGKSADEYYAAIRDDAVTLRLKEEDIGDNKSEQRLMLLPKDVAARLRAKYQKALIALGSTRTE